jgi:pyruvate/2-oxoglutarate dehydrogenase complex dihydrolipoamide acyltransferase (E2) component
MHAHAGQPSDPLPMQPRQDVPSGEWLPIAAAAHRLGCSIDTVRRRVKAQELPRRQVPMQGGYRWEVFVPLAEGAPGQHRQERPSPSPPEPTQPTQPMQALPTPPEPVVPTQPTQDLQALVALVRDLTDRNVQLAGQVGFWQARAQLAEERVKLLEAPREPSAEAPTETAESTVSVPRPWWERWLWWRHG